MTWTATGRVKLLIEAMRPDPQRVFTAPEAATIMGCHTKHVRSSIEYAVANKAMYSKGFGPGIPMLMRGAPFPDGYSAIPSTRKPPKPSQTWKEGKEPIPDKGWLTDPNDPRIGKVVENWKPPVMRHVRGGA